MNTPGFDRLSRTVAAHRTRRAALTGLLGSALGLVGMTETDARKKKGKKKRKKGAAPPVSPPVSPPPPPISPPLPPPPPPPPPPGCGAGGPCLVFLSSSRHPVNFGGPNSADAICQNLAAAAGLSGSFKAWISDSTSAASSRFTPSPGPYRLVNGTTIANSWTDLRDGSLLAPINVTENGGDNGGNFGVWTGTQTNGSVATNHCNNWTAAAGFTGAIGSASATDETWTELANVSCTPPTNFIHFYCFQQR